MKVVVVVMVVLALGSGCWFASPVIPLGGKSSRQVQHDSLGKLFPAQLTAQRTRPGEPRTAKLRVWADDEYRAQNMRWQRTFDEQLDYVNQVLIPMLGLRLEADYKSWSRHAPAGTLSDHLEALARLDPGDDVGFVVGLTSSLSLVSESFDQLGIAELGGRHLVLRGHADLEERKAFERAFPDIRTAEREGVIEARRRHKITTVLLHELAHCLGAIHETEADWVMNATYSHHAASITDRNRELMLIAVDDRLKPADQRDPRATARATLAALDVGAGGWETAERDQRAATMREQLGAQPAVGITGTVPGAAAEQYHHAEQLLASGDPGSAQATIEPLIMAYPAHAEIRMLSCKIELARGGAKDARALATCDRAAALSTDVEPAIAVAVARLTAGDAAGARATLVTAEARVASFAPDKAGAAWLSLAAQYQQMGAVTWAENAIARSGAVEGADHGITAWVKTSRARYGLPRDAAHARLVPADDAVAVAAVRGVLALIALNKLDAAAKAAITAENRWPGLPGLLAVRCDVAMRRGQLAAARQHCDRAIARGGSSWALYLRAIIELRTDSAATNAFGIARLREAIALDPDLAQAWRALGKALDRITATRELDELRRDYRARFNAQLPN